MPGTWIDELKIILNQICMHMNGSPCSFGDEATASDRIASIWALYQANACQGLSGNEAQTDLQDLKDHLALPGNTLDSADDAHLDTIILSCLGTEG